MIRKLQFRFIRIAMISLTVAMVLVVGIVNVANWISVRKELSDTLNLLAESEAFPVPSVRSEGKSASEAESPAAEEQKEEAQPRRPFGFSRHVRNMVSESSWFSALLAEDGSIDRVLMDRMENLSEEDAKELIREAAAQGRTEGMIRDYLFRVRVTMNGNREVVMLSCETRLSAVRTIILISVAACAGGILLAWALVTLFSRKAIAPTIRNMEQQKQFITNASHELKTPLTVIATNMELLQMDTEDNPWVRSTLKQTAMLRKLVDELVYLSRMEEECPALEIETLDPGRLLKETAEPFIAMAEYKGWEMTVTAEKNLQMNGDRASIQRLMSTLCDNAVKYASEGPILAGLRNEGKNIVLQVSNPVEAPLTKQQCDQLFDRFYRLDKSRNKDRKSGFGIGLAIAAAIVKIHNGKISAAMDGNRLVFTCLMPKEAKKEKIPGI